ncbi:MAG: pyridoxamine 5'-phosphate oxidase family protein [bacterium]
MADWFNEISNEQRDFIEGQHVFFVATAPAGEEGDVNLSPKGRTLLRVLAPNLVGYLDYPGSGNETAKHLSESERITLMLCSFDAQARILRLYGKGKRVDLDAPELAEHRSAFIDDFHPFVRQAFFVEVEKVQTSCGYAVPKMSFESERDTLDRYCENKMQPREMIDGVPQASGLFRKDGTLVAQR